MQEGETEAVLNVALNRDNSDPNTCPVFKLSVLHDDGSDYADLLIIMPHEGLQSFDQWAESLGHSEINSGPLGDEDHDGSRNVVELTCITDPSNPASLPQAQVNNEWSFSLSLDIRQSPQVAVFGEFCDDLNWENAVLVPGYWEWDESSGTYHIDFSPMEERSFARIRFEWLE